MYMYSAPLVMLLSILCPAAPPLMFVVIVVLGGGGNIKATQHFVDTDWTFVRQFNTQ